MTRHPSRRSRQLAATLSQTVRRTADHLGTTKSEARFARALFDTMGRGARPPGATRTAIEMDGVPAHLITTPEARANRSALLYVHGGGFVFGSSRSHGALVAWLAHRAGMPVWFPEYRRAPEHRYPAARQDVLTAYRHLLDSGIPAARIAIAGDSAGGHIIADVLAELSSGREPGPGAAVLFSPWLDLTCDSLFTADQARRDPFASPHYARRTAAAYLGDIAPGGPPIEVTGGDLSAWPPTLVQAGDTECMLPSIEGFARNLRAAGVPTSLQIWPGQVHVFQAMSGFLPEGRLALREAGAFLAAQLGDEEAA